MEFHSGTTSSWFHTEYIDYIRLYDTGWSFILVRLHPGSILSIYIDYIRLYDTGWSFILVRLHPGSILSIYIDYIRLYDTGWSFILVRLHPGSILSMIPIKISFPNESFQNESIPQYSFRNQMRPNVPQVSCKGCTSSFGYEIRHVDCLGRLADSCFRPADIFTALSFQNENFSV